MTLDAALRALAESETRIHQLEATVRTLAAADARVQELAAERQGLLLRVKDLEQQLAARRTGKAAPEPDRIDPAVLSFFREEDHDASPPAAPVAPGGMARGPQAAGTLPHGRTAPPAPRRKPLDPTLRREVIRLPDPPPTTRVDVFTGAPLVPGFTETLEVLARKPAEYYVKHYERTVWVSPDKTAPVATPWPPSALPRSNIDASVVAHIAVAHFSEHTPYYRLEQQLARTGITLARSTQVSLMAQLEARVAPVLECLQRHVLASGYVHLDATPIDVCDPARPGETRSATVWAYRARSPDPEEDGLVWFDYRATKSPAEPRAVLRAAAYRGVVQTDGAAGLDTLGPPEQITHLGCWAHARRYFVDALAAPDVRAGPYLTAIDRLFRLEARARAITRATAVQDPRYQHRRARVATWRDRFSIPVLHAFFTRAATEIVTLPPKTALATALGYVLGQRAALTRCLTTPHSSLDNNPVENAIRPLKLGARNWLFIGHPDAGPRLANLYTLIENCRQAAVDPEAYLIDLIAALVADGPPIIADWLPRAWKRRRATGLLA